MADGAGAGVVGAPGCFRVTLIRWSSAHTHTGHERVDALVAGKDHIIIALVKGLRSHAHTHTTLNYKTAAIPLFIPTPILTVVETKCKTR